jgi:segregation and condensation protein B
MEQIKPILEALLLASDAPLSVEKIRDILPEAERDEINRQLAELVSEYEARNGGFHLCAVAGGYQFRTRPDFSAWIKKLKGARTQVLSPAAMETLAVVAYRQPVMKSEVDKIRGVDSSASVKGLLDKKIIRMVGRKDVPGKPMLYGTTKKFLEMFNLNDLSELPTLRELKELEGDSELQAHLDLKALGGNAESPTLREVKQPAGNSELPVLQESREPEDALELPAPQDLKEREGDEV